MAKKPKQEEAPAGSPAWMATFYDGSHCAPHLGGPYILCKTS